ncbi:MAG: hypothetical protein H7841_07700 [Magnetospirillum sp. WYHS-4]
MSDAAAVRQAIIAAPLEIVAEGKAPCPATLYIPPSHIKALRFESSLIQGGRGVGKSFWAAALGSPDLRKAMRAAVPDLDRTDVRIGFSVGEDIDSYPNPDVFAQMRSNGSDPYDIWRAVVVRWLAGVVSEPLNHRTWEETVAWIKESPEEVARLMKRSVALFAEKERFGLIVFDALDRTGNDWTAMDDVVRGVLRAALWLKSFPRLHAKVFLREDQLERTVTDFPDASKLLATKTELTWAQHDLHGLLWQRLINAPDGHGEILRKLHDSAPLRLTDGFTDEFYPLPEESKRDAVLRALFEKLAGPWMGRDRRRGIPYVWSVGHLADGRGQTSPRSFLAAIFQAAEDSRDRYGSHDLALHYESIKRGIQKASQIRVAEVAEDYPWVQDTMSPLGGVNVPCDYSLIENRWKESMPQGLPTSEQRLPPEHLARGWDGIREDLVRLGILTVKKDGRVDMPDLYRVGFRLGRKGGVKPRSG